MLPQARLKSPLPSLRRLELIRRCVLAPGLALLVGACSASVGPPSPPSVFNDPGPLAGDRYMSSLTRLTTDGDNGEAYFSADGAKLIFQSNRGEQACDKIWTMNIDGSGKRMVSPERGAHTCSYFLPDGESVVFASTSHLEGECPVKTEVPGEHYVWPLYPFDIYSARSDGSELVRLTDNPGYDAEPIVSADGKSIVFGSKREGDFDIYTMDVDGRNVRRLTDREGYDGGPWFSPDGSKIAWRAWHPETEEGRAKWRGCMEGDYIVPFPLDLWVMDTDGGNKMRLTRNGATNWAPSWHPDGRRMVFSSNMDDWRADIGRFGHNFELYLIDADGGGLERITHNDVFDSFPMFSADGSKLVFGSNRNAAKPRATDVFIADWVEPQRPVRHEIHHELEVRLDPAEGRVSVVDEVTLPPGFEQEFRFALHRGLQVRSTTAGVLLRKLAEDGEAALRLAYLYVSLQQYESSVAQVKVITAQSWLPYVLSTSTG